MLLTIPFTLLGCNQKKEAPITNKDESTIIKDAKSTDEYLKKEDYKSIAYAYIYNIKEGIKSYESETNGTVKAKVMFFNYDIKYNSITYKSGSKFYSKDNSTSALMSVKNEFYMVDKEKILVSNDLKKYNVYTLEDYHKISYSPDQYTIMGYVFNDQSINKAELVSDKDDTVSIKYTLDNELATNLVKVDFKNNGGLSKYPVFKKIEMTLEMKRDFTPVSYAINAVYDASKPVLGTSEVTQDSKCLFSNVNGTITIPNETFLAEKLGADPSEVVIDDKEQAIKDDLMTALKNLDFKNGVKVNGNLSLELAGAKIGMDLNTNLSFDMERLTKDKIYDALRLYAKAEGDENFGSLVSMLKMALADKLGDFAQILDDFKSVEVVYDGDGYLYIIPTNKNNLKPTMLKAKVTDVLDLILRQVNIYNLVNGANNDMFSFNKIEGKDKDNYEVELTLTDESKQYVKDKLNELFSNPDYSIIKLILGYKDFDSIKIKLGVVDGVLSSADASFNYLKTDDTVMTILTLHLDLKSETFDFDTQMNAAKVFYAEYLSVQELKARINELIKNVYVSRQYVKNVEKAIIDYQALNEQQKVFVGVNALDLLTKNKNDVNNVMAFISVLDEYDLNSVNNEDLLVLIGAYKQYSPNTTLLAAELSEELYNKVTSLDSLIDYSSLTSTIAKINGDDETAWGLTEQEIRNVKLILDISELDSSVTNKITLDLILAGKTITADAFKTKIMALYNNL